MTLRHVQYTSRTESGWFAKLEGCGHFVRLYQEVAFRIQEGGGRVVCRKCERADAMEEVTQ